MERNLVKYWRQLQSISWQSLLTCQPMGMKKKKTRDILEWMNRLSFLFLVLEHLRIDNACVQVCGCGYKHAYLSLIKALLCNGKKTWVWTHNIIMLWKQNWNFWLLHENWNYKAFVKTGVHDSIDNKQNDNIVLRGLLCSVLDDFRPYNVVHCHVLKWC